MKKQTFEERFWAKVNKNGPLQPGMKTKCWEWTACKDEKGYGRLRLRGRMVRAHQAAWELKTGKLPTLDILHRCDNTSCVRHLFEGTQQDNMTDMVLKGRSATGARNGRHTKPECTARGTKVARAKLTETQVLNLRAEAGKGVTTAALARKYKLTWPGVDCIIRRETWKHI